MAFTSVDDPTIYFNTVLWTGTGSSHAITGVGFQPDWVWIKNRVSGNSHHLYDVVRGTTKRLASNNGNTESTESGGLTAFGSDGFTLGNSGAVNGSSETYVGWNWIAGTSFSNSAGANGADLASTGSFSRTAGFSIVTFTGNATANQQIYHGLNSVPKWMVLKNRTNSNNESWCVYHDRIGNTKKLTLNSTATPSTDVEFWQDTTPTSTVLTVGRQDAVNGSGNTHVVYCFSEIQGYSKFGTYVGNGNADGPFAFTGFKPAWVMVKATDASKSWYMFDNKRPGFNEIDLMLLADTNDTESSDAIDFLSNGFKLRTSGSGENGSGTNYVFMAFAESPFVNSNGVPNNAG